MKNDHPAQPSTTMVPLAHPCTATAMRQHRQTTRLERLHPVQAPETGAEIAPLHATQAQCLVLVQEGRVVCVVERHRHDSACSVARLLCRLLQSDAKVYACPREEADHLHSEQRVDEVPDTWREIYRATPWAEPMVEEAESLPVIGIR